jgi:hypothetical protein
VAHWVSPSDWRTKRALVQGAQFLVSIKETHRFERASAHARSKAVHPCRNVAHHPQGRKEAAMKIMTTALIAAGLSQAAPAAYAGCWRVGDLAGTAYSAGNGYKAEPDGYGKYASSIFEVSISGDQAYVTGHDAPLVCRPITAHEARCEFSDGARHTTIIWTIDEASKRVVHVKSITGFGALDGAKVFVGKILGSC